MVYAVEAFGDVRVEDVPRLEADDETDHGDRVVA
jgi:hypothetical protein